MSEQTVITGYICTDEERVLIRCLVPVGFVFMLFWGCVLWVQVLINKSSLLHWLCAVSWSCFVAFLIVRAHSCRIVSRTQFCLDSGGTVMNIYSPNNAIALDVCDGIFITTVPLDFGYGKAVVKRTFYLLSSQPYTINLVKEDGLLTLKRFVEKGIVIIPQDKETDVWITSNLKTARVPCYPAVAFKCKTASTGGQGDGDVVPSENPQ